MNEPFMWLTRSSLAAVRTLEDPADAKKCVLLLVALGDLASERFDGKHQGFEATVAEVIERMAVSRNTYKEARRLLEELGLLTVEQPIGRAGNLPAVWHLNPAPGEHGRESLEEQPGGSTLDGFASTVDPPHAGGRDSQKKDENKGPNGPSPDEGPELKLIAADPEPADPVLAVFEHWRHHMPGRQGARPTPGRKSIIGARLKDGFSVAELKAVIDHIALSGYHNGDNPTGAVYNDFKTIFRNAEKVEDHQLNAKKAAGARDRPRVVETQGMRPRDRALAEKQERDDRASAAWDRILGAS
jgi:hypothetical protein